jgi:hypothetical protein
MSQSAQKIRHQLQILQEGVDDAWLLEPVYHTKRGRHLHGLWSIRNAAEGKGIIMTEISYRIHYDIHSPPNTGSIGQRLRRSAQARFARICIIGKVSRQPRRSR